MPQEPKVRPPNAFSPDFLHQKEQVDEPNTAAEAEAAGSWKVVPMEHGHAVLREEESLEEGDRPTAVFTDLYVALYAAAIFSILDRNPAFVLASEEDDQGYPVVSGTQVAGHLRRFNVPFVEALNLFDSLASTPRSLALLLEATSGLGLERAGRMLASRFPHPRGKEVGER
jgi:hypothetical protein